MKVWITDLDEWLSFSCQWKTKYHKIQLICSHQGWWEAMPNSVPFRTSEFLLLVSHRMWIGKMYWKIAIKSAERITCVCVCTIWMGALVSDDTWFASAMVTISPFDAELGIVVVWFDCAVVELIWLLGVIVTKLRCSASWAAIPSDFPLCRMETRLTNFFLVFVSVFLVFQYGVVLSKKSSQSSCCLRWRNVNYYRQMLVLNVLHSKNQRAIEQRK